MGWQLPIWQRVCRTLRNKCLYFMLKYSSSYKSNILWGVVFGKAGENCKSKLFHRYFLFFSLWIKLFSSLSLYLFVKKNSFPLYLFISLWKKLFSSLSLYLFVNKTLFLFILKITQRDKLCHNTHCNFVRCIWSDR